MNEIKYIPSTFSLWVQMLRPKTLIAAVVPFSAGSALAYASGALISWGLFFYALIAALCIQIATNLINDAFDSAKGADDRDRLGPKRAIQQGLATEVQIYFLGLAFFVMAFLFGLPLMLHGGTPIALIMALSILAGYAYTGGPFPLAYIGLGEVFVVLFFGWVSTLSAYWLQSGILDVKSLLLGTQIGLLCTLMIAINNLRDIEGDTRAHKRTLAVRFGTSFAKCEIALLTLVPFMLNSLWLYWGYVFAMLLPFLTAPLGALLVSKVWRTAPSKTYNKYLGFAALLHLTFGVLLSVGFLLQ